MLLTAFAEKLTRRAKDDFKGRHFEPWLIIQASLLVSARAPELPRRKELIR